MNAKGPPSLVKYAVPKMTEEKPVTTMALGEEGGSKPKPPPMTTMAVGEEAGSPPGVTTMAMGEEGGSRP